MNSPDSSLQSAAFAFRGTVEHVGAATEAAIAASDATAVVRVDQVLLAPEALAGFEGQLVTLEMQQAGSVQQGEEAVFFANPWLFGETLALHEVGHQPVDALATIDLAKARADAALRERLDRAELVVIGRVADVRALPSSGMAGAAGPGLARESEHDPHWREAVLAVDNAIKGEPPAGETVLLFPASEDIAWARAPKFEPGQEGVFVLHRGEDVPGLRAVTALAAPAYIALEPLDVHPPEAAERVAELVSGE